MTDFAISDLHFSHKNMLTFKRKDNGLPLRPWTSVEEADEALVDNWNKTVGDNDTIYLLGDFSFGGKQNIEKFARRLRGTIMLALGNHDYNAKDYVPHFAWVSSWYDFKKKYRMPLVLQHYPLYESAFRKRFDSDAVCIHGHLHDLITPEPYHVNVCVENTNFRPRAIEEIVDSLR